MSTVIRIVKTEDLDHERSTLSLEEREILFKKMAMESNIDEYHFRAFLKGENQMIDEDNSRELPKILTVLARRVFNHPYIVPIWKSSFKIKEPKYQYVQIHVNRLDIPDVPESAPDSDDEEPGEIDVGIDIKPDVLSKVAEQNTIFEGIATGGKVIPEITKEPIKLDIPVNLFTFPLQMDQAKLVFIYTPHIFDLPDWTRYQIAADQTFDVCGFVILKPNIYPTEYGRRINDMISHDKQVFDGIYNYPELASLPEFAHVPMLESQVYLFSDEKFAHAALISAFNCIVQIDDYYKGANSQMNFQQEIKSYIKKSQVKSEIQKHLIDVFHIPKTGNSQPYKKEKLPPLLIALLKKIESVHQITGLYYDQIMLDLLDAGLFELWEHVTINGFDRDFDDKLNELKIEQERHRQILDYQHQEYETFAKNMHYISIAKTKFGKARAKKLSMHRDVLSQLSSKERELVELEYRKQQKLWYIIQSNTCKAIPVMTKFRNSISIEEQDLLYNELKGLLKPKVDSNHQYVDKECGIPILCEHVEEEFLLRRKRTPYTKIRDALYKYVGDVNIADRYFCKYCSEQLFEPIQVEVNEFMQELGQSQEPRVDRIRSIIWGETSYLIYNRLYFKNIFSVKSLIQHIVDDVYNEIYTIETRLNKAKTNTPDIVEEKIQLYSLIYSIANLISIIKTNPNKLWFSSKKNQKVASKSNKLEVLFKQALIIIIDSKNITIRKYNISNANLVIMLKKAYVALVRKQAWTDQKPKSQLLEWLTADPVYDYFYSGIILDNISKGKKIPDKYNLGELFSKSEKDLRNAKGFYEFAKFPQFEKFAPAPSSVADAASYADMKDAYWKACFIKYFKGRIISKLYLEPLYSRQHVNEKLIGRDMELLDMERALFGYKKIQTYPMYAHYHVLPQDTRRYNSVPIDMATLYDETGRRHRWKIYVYKTKNGKSELTADEIEKIQSRNHKITPKEFDSYELVDYRCLDCKQYKSKVRGRNIDGILDELDNLDNFYRYYEFRCPVGEIHEWVVGDIKGPSEYCKKCHITKEQIKQKDRVYYRKYATIYQKRIKKSGIVEFNKPAPMSSSDFAKKWKFNTHIITELSRLTGRKYNVLSNLGLTEGYEYDRIVNGTDNPAINVKPTMTRMNRIIGYMNLLLREYYMLRTRSILKAVPYEIRNMIKTHEFTFDSLPDVGDTFQQNINHFKNDCSRGINFALEAIYRAILSILKHDKNKELMKELGTYFINKILKIDELYAKPKEVNLGLISDKGVDEDKMYESEPEDEPIDSEEVGRFSADGYDYEPDENEDHEPHGEY